MKLKFILGSSGSGKTTYIINEIISKEINHPDKNIIFIVPEQFSLQAERDLVFASKSRTILRSQVLSFKRLAYHIFAELGRADKPLLDDVSKAILLRKILNDNLDKMYYFKNSMSNKSGFVNKISKTISEFFQYCITEEKLNSFIAENEEKKLTDNLSLKIKDIGLVYSKYLEVLDKSYISSDETLDYFSEKISQSNLLKNSIIYIDAFNGFTPQEFNVIEQLFKTAESVNVALTLNLPALSFSPPNIFDPFFDSKSTVKKLTALARQAGAVLEEPVYLKENLRHKENKELAFLEQNYFSYPKKKYTKTPQLITVSSGVNKFEEIKNAASYITMLVKKENYRYSDIAVIVTGEDYIDCIKNTFSRYDIPFFTDIKKSIKNHPLTELICSALDTIVYNYSYESVFGYVKTGFLEECEKYNITKSELDILENYALEYGIKGYRWEQEQWSCGFYDGSKYVRDVIYKAKNAFLESLSPLKMDNINTYNVREMATYIMDFLKNIDAAKTLAKKGEMYLERFNNPLVKKENTQVWKNITGVLNSTVEIFSDEKMTLKEYHAILSSAFEACQVGFVPTSQDQVLIGDFGRTKLPNIKALIMLNTNDGVLPGAKSDIGFINDAERDFLKENEIELAPNTKRLIFQDNFIAYTMLTKPSDRLFISYSCFDSSLKETKPSIIVDSIMAVFTKLNISSNSSLDYNSINNISAPEPAFDALISSVKSYKTGEPSNIIKDTYSFFKANEKFAKRLNRIKAGLFKLNPQERLNPDTIKKLYPHNSLAMSVTRLEKFRQCPFSYFAGYILHLSPRESYEINNMNIGNIFHSSLENFSFMLAENKIDWKNISPREMGGYIDEAVDKSILQSKTDIFTSSSEFIHSIENIKYRLKFSAAALINRIKRGNYTPYGFEFLLSSPKTDENGKCIEESAKLLKPIEIELENGYKFILNGKIDRVDTFDKDNKTYVSIIDYKTGSRSYSVKLAEIYYGVQIQLMMYIDAFIKLKQKSAEFKNKELVPGGMFYFKISDFSVSKSEDITEDNFQKKLRYDGILNSKRENMAGFEKELESTYDDSKKPKFNYLKAELFSQEDINCIMEYVNIAAAETANEIIEGNIKIYPMISPVDSCSCCQFSTICGFDRENCKIYGESCEVNDPCNSNDDYLLKMYNRLGIDVQDKEDTE